MKYDLKEFNKAVEYYEQHMKKFKSKEIFLVLDIDNEKAFFSIAPLSRAAHNLNCDIDVRVINKSSDSVDVLIDVWNVFDDLKKGVNNAYTKALDMFIREADRKAKGEFRKVFKRPELFMHASHKEFFTNAGFRLQFKTAWFKKYRWNKLLQTAKLIWNQVYDLKTTEKTAIGFDLIMKAKDMKYPLEDYLDSYAIARTMMLACLSKQKSMKADTSRKTMLEKSPKITELSSALLGCELEKEINEPVFKKYKILSKLLKLNRIKTNSAVFFIAGEGMPGKHIFGETIGYPTPDKKSRWSSPGGIIFQFSWAPQTKIDSRAPLCRVGFTDTLPIDIFIESNYIDWLEMKRKNDNLIKIVNQSEKVFVESEKSKTNLEVALLRPKGERRIPHNSDIDLRKMLNKHALKKGIKAGNMANIPGGEMFVTPEYLKGTFYGDVVISIDKSYVLDSKNPIAVKCDEKGYKIISGPKKIIEKINEKKKESMKILKMQEKNKAIPKVIAELKKKNFNKIGEFAINTNPNAKLCNYLIVNEKIAGMIHIALGSGFEDDRATTYHYDIVINAKEQKLNIYGIKKEGKKEKKLWMMREGKLII